MEDGQKNECVKVVVRLRPLSQSERSSEEFSQVVEVDVERKEILVEGRNRSRGEGDVKPFTFDAVFDSSFSQREIYSSVFAPLVASVLEGFNGTIFAYGQTGTGKTFTMEGSLEEGEEGYGVMPSAFAQIFEEVGLNKEKRYLIGVSYFEIYQEEIRDLLLGGQGQGQGQGTAEKRTKCTIHEHPSGGIHIKGLSSYLCSNLQDMLGHLKKGRGNRATGATNMNEHSSRSHAVFQISVEAASEDGDKIRVGKLNLVDLAGSERVGKTGAEGQRLKEAGKINLSLSTLGNVISALVERASFIPYRDSKLTRLLQDSLGGNSRTIMVATVGPAKYNLEETLNTLRYASRAKNIENKPRVNQDPKDAVLKKYQDEIHRLKKLVEERKQGSGHANAKPPKLKTNRPQTESLSLSSSSGCREDDPSILQELTDLLTPLGITFTGDLEEVRRLLKERTEALESDTLMVKEEKASLSSELLRAGLKLDSAEKEVSALLNQIRWLESKVLNSAEDLEGNHLLKRTLEQEELLLLKEKELEFQKRREDELQEEVRSNQMTNADLEAALIWQEGERQRHLRKLGKLEERLGGFEGEEERLRGKAGEEREDLLQAVIELKKELKLKKAVSENFIPKRRRKDLEERMRFEPEVNAFYVEDKEEEGIQVPEVSNTATGPLINLTRRKELPPFPKGTFSTNENVLLLEPCVPEWRAAPFLATNLNPRVDSLIRNALKDVAKPLLINCDHRGRGGPKGGLRGHDPAPTYFAVGDKLLLKSVRPGDSDKYIDFVQVPTDKLPPGANVFPIQVPKKGPKSPKFSIQQLKAFPLLKYSANGDLTFDNENSPQPEGLSYRPGTAASGPRPNTVITPRLTQKPTNFLPRQ